MFFPAECTPCTGLGEQAGRATPQLPGHLEIYMRGPSYWVVECIGRYVLAACCFMFMLAQNGRDICIKPTYVTNMS